MTAVPDITMHWMFFLGGSFLTAALLVPHAGARPVMIGIALAAVVQWGWSQIDGSRDGRE